MANSKAAEKLEPVEGEKREVLVRGRKSGEKWKETATPESKGTKDEVVKQCSAGRKN